MSTKEDYISYVFAWHSLSDACDKCKKLDGREWHDQNIYQGRLWDYIYGDVWNLDGNHSMAHGMYQYNCRCQLEVRVIFDWDKIRELNLLQQTLSHYGYEVELPKTEAVEMSADIFAIRDAVSSVKEEVNTLIPQAREMNRLLTISLALGRRLGSEELTQLITLFQQGRITAEMFYRSAVMLYTATGPIGWLIGLGGMALGGLMLADMAEIRRPRY